MGWGQVAARNDFEGQSLWEEVGWVRAELPAERGGPDAGLGRLVSFMSGP